jgi:hypothetical protein
MEGLWGVRGGGGGRVRAAGKAPRTGRQRGISGAGYAEGAFSWKLLGKVVRKSLAELKGGCSGGFGGPRGVSVDSVSLQHFVVIAESCHLGLLLHPPSLCKL